MSKKGVILPILGNLRSGDGDEPSYASSKAATSVCRLNTRRGRLQDTLEEPNAEAEEFFLLISYPSLFFVLQCRSKSFIECASCERTCNPFFPIYFETAVGSLRSTD
jgi:hypothetical protein